MKIAIPVWQKRVAPVFDVAATFIIITENGNSLSREQFEIHSESAVERISLLVKLNVDLLICGAISKSLQLFATNNSIELIPFVSGDVDEIISAWKNGSIFNCSFNMPGCGQRKRFQQRGRNKRSKKDVV